MRALAVCATHFNEDGKKRRCMTGQKETLIVAKNSTKSMARKLQTHLNGKLCFAPPSSITGHRLKTSFAPPLLFSQHVPLYGPLPSQSPPVAATLSPNICHQPLSQRQPARTNPLYGFGAPFVSQKTSQKATQRSWHSGHSPYRHGLIELPSNTTTSA